MVAVPKYVVIDDGEIEEFPRLGSIEFGNRQIPVELNLDNSYPSPGQMLSTVWDRNGFNIPITREELRSPQLRLPEILRIETPEQWECIRRIVSHLLPYIPGDVFRTTLVRYVRVDEVVLHGHSRGPDPWDSSYLYTFTDILPLTPRFDLNVPQDSVATSEVLPDKPLGTGVIRKLKHRRSEKK